MTISSSRTSIPHELQERGSIRFPRSNFKSQILRCVRITLLLLFTGSLSHAQKTFTLTNDGAWCWFSDPRAIYTRLDKGKIVTGWVSKDGDVYAASLDPATGKTLHHKLY